MAATEKPLLLELGAEPPEPLVAAATGRPPENGCGIPLFSKLFAMVGTKVVGSRSLKVITGTAPCSLPTDRLAEESSMPTGIVGVNPGSNEVLFAPSRTEDRVVKLEAKASRVRDEDDSLPMLGTATPSTITGATSGLGVSWAGTSVVGWTGCSSGAAADKGACPTGAAGAGVTGVGATGSSGGAGWTGCSRGAGAAGAGSTGVVGCWTGC